MSLMKYTLGEVCDFQGGSQPPKGEWAKEPQEGYIRMLQIRDFTKSRDVAPEYVKLSKKLRKCSVDDILIGRYGASVGKILTGLSGAYNVALIKAIPNESVISKPYIKLIFESPSFQHKLQIICGQRAAQAGFSKEDIQDFPVIIPPLSEQQRIVDILNAEFAKIDALKENAEKNLQNAKDLFQAVLRKELEPKEEWESKTIDGVVKDIFSGGDAPKGNMSKDPTEEYKIPIYANAVENDGLYGYTNCARVQEPSITVAARGSGTGYTLRRYDVYLPIVRLIVLIPNPDVVSLDYLYYNLRSMNIDISGSAIPQLTVPMLKKHTVSFPTSLEEQAQIASILDNLQSKCVDLTTNYEKTIILCNDLKQALLRKAFNGEL